MNGERRMASLREAEREELIRSLHPKARQNSARRGKQIDGCRRFGRGMKVAVPRHVRGSESDVVRRDVDEARAGEDCARRRTLERLSARFELAGDVGIR